jgi:hypothetical protein
VAVKRERQHVDRPVSSRTAALVAWGAGVLCLAGTAAGLVLTGLNGAFDRQFIGPFASVAGALIAFPAVGALVAARQPRNPVGWQLLAVGALLTLGLPSDAYARYTLVTAPGSLPAGLPVALVGGLAFAPTSWILLVLLPLYFPTGRLLSPRWRLVAWSGAAFMVLAIIGNGLLPDTLEVSGIGVVRSPIAVPSATGVLDVLITLALPFLVLGIGGAVAAVIVRFRRAGAVERTQLKWFVFAVALTPLPFIAHDAAPRIANALFAVILPLVPVSIGVAILRYRLYDIDRIINRTLVYGLLTALLGGVYAAVVLVLGQLFGGVEKNPPSLAVAGATLAVAAAFQPARRRIQQAVDRRFNRHKYNAAKTIEVFSARLREHIDLDALSTELLAVVDQTMEPTHVSLWFRPSPQDSSGTARSEARPTSWAY